MHALPDLPQLSTFLSIAETRSITASARALHLTQPAVSKRLQQLESKLGVSLFDRINKRLMLTPAGQALLPRARELLLMAQDMQRHASSLHGDIAGDLKIAASHHVGLRRLPSYLRQFRQNYTDVHLQIDFLDSEVAIAGVLQGRYEAALVTLPDEPSEHHNKLCYQLLWDDPMHWVAAADHPLLTSRTNMPVALSELARYPAVLPEKDTHTYQIVAMEFERHGLPLVIGMHNNFMETIRMLVSCGFGWSLLPATVLSSHDPQRLVDLATPLRLSRQLGVVTHQDRTHSQAARTFIDTLLSSQ